MRQTLFASALFASALLCGAAAQAQQGIEPIRSDFIEMLSATNAALDAQSAFNRARAGNDAEAAKDAAATLLVATGEAAFWSRVLQRQVTPANTNEQIVSSVAVLNELSARAFSQLTPVVLEGDMAALERALDESADTLTGLAQAVSSIALWIRPS